MPPTCAAAERDQAIRIRTVERWADRQPRRSATHIFHAASSGAGENLIRRDHLGVLSGCRGYRRGGRLDRQRNLEDESMGMSWANGNASDQYLKPRACAAEV